MPERIIAEFNNPRTVVLGCGLWLYASKFSNTETGPWIDSCELCVAPKIPEGVVCDNNRFPKAASFVWSQNPVELLISDGVYTTPAKTPQEFTIKSIVHTFIEGIRDRNQEAFETPVNFEPFDGVPLVPYTCTGFHRSIYTRFHVDSHFPGGGRPIWDLSFSLTGLFDDLEANPGTGRLTVTLYFHGSGYCEDGCMKERATFHAIYQGHVEYFDKEGILEKVSEFVEHEGSYYPFGGIRGAVPPETILYLPFPE